MEIRFRGLICHAQFTADGGKTRDLAVFIEYPDHVANLMVHKNDVLDHQGPYSPSADFWCFKLRNLVTTSLGSGLAASRNMPEVPSLLDARVASGDRTPDDAARNRQPSNRFRAILDLPPRGNYSVYQHFKDRAVFGAEPFGCIAHTVAYTVQTDDDVRVDLGSEGRFVVIERNAVFFMDNRSPASGTESAHVPSHFLSYTQLFHGTTVITAPTPDNVACTSRQKDQGVYCGGFPELDVDCSNSRFP